MDTSSLINTAEYFGAANTSRGFENYFPNIFNPKNFDRIYIIKGGPGSGKSTIMKKIAKAAVQKGYEPILYRCSSDVQSLDGIIVENIGIIDGTSPHICEARYPGAVERIIDTGRFFDCEKLKKHRAKIEEAVLQKENLYRIVCKYLSASGEIKKAIDMLLLSVIDYDKMRAAVKRIIKKSNFEKGVAQCLPIEAISGAGHIHLDSYKNGAKRIFYVYDKYQAGEQFIEAVKTEAEKNSLGFVYSPGLIGKETREIKIGDTVFALTNDANAANLINTERFIKKDELKKVRAKLRFLIKLCDSITKEACALLAEIKEIHLSLEKIYSSATDFESQNLLCEEICKEIF